MTIIKGTEPMPVEHPIFLINGEPGIGKSSLGYSTREPLLLDFDRGAHRAANRRDTLVINGWADVVELSDAEILAPYQTIVVDTVGRCLDLITAEIIRESPKLGPGGNLSQQGWGALKTRFRTWMSTLRGYGKDVLLISHDREDKDGDTRIHRPDITGGSYGEVLKVADFVGFLYLSGRDRILDFSPTDRWVGKNPAQWAPFKVPPVGQASAFMAGLMDQGRAALGAISSESAKVLQQIEDWKLAVQDATDPASFNRLMGDLSKFAPVAAPQAKRILWEAAQGRGWLFDTTAKHFTAAPAEPVAAGA